jgi:hypothetical protein
MLLLSYRCFADHQMKAPILPPWPGPHAVILDNCAIHHDEHVQQFVEVECGILVFIFHSAMVMQTCPQVHNLFTSHTILAGSQPNRTSLSFNQSLASSS